jgi:Phage-related tail fibre protein
MANTRIRGSTQILGNSVTATEVNASIIIAAGTNPHTGDQSMGSFKLTNVAVCTNPQDAANKAYVDAAAQGLDVKVSVRVATTANIPLTGIQTIDGVTLIAGNRVLIKNQTAGQDNGIWTVASGAWVRATDADVSAEVSSGLFTFVEEGTTNANSGWLLTTPDPITLGTTPLAFAQFSGAGTVAAGAGLTKTGNVIDVIGGDGLVVAADLVSANIDTAAGLKFDASTPKKMQVALDGTSLSVSGLGLKVNPAFLTASFITRETPAGLMNGANTVFTLAAAPVGGSEQVFLNGLLQEPGAGNDYTIAGATITYLAAPAATDRMRVNYRV